MHKSMRIETVKCLENAREKDEGKQLAIRREPRALRLQRDVKESGYKSGDKQNKQPLLELLYE
jgi:hypothetical protein